MIILIWIICGYVLTLSYESVLRAILMKTYYEKKIDSIDDVLATDREVISFHTWRDMMASDPRLKVRDLARRARPHYSDFGQQDQTEFVGKGYVLMI